MASDDLLLAYMNLPLADRWAVERLLPGAARGALQRKVKARLRAETAQRRRVENPAALLTCGLALAKHLIRLEAGNPEAPATERTRRAVGAAIEKFSVA